MTTQRAAFPRIEAWRFAIYNSCMTIEQLRAMHSARPFKPFEIHLADSRMLAVEHPELLSQSQSGRTIAVACPDDTIEIIDLLLVESLKHHANGSPRRGRPRS
jgi:hypothetical protein